MCTLRAVHHQACPQQLAGAQAIRAHSDSVRAASFSCTDLKFATASDDSTVKVRARCRAQGCGRDVAIGAHCCVPSPTLTLLCEDATTPVTGELSWWVS